jgi:hypothetical protein
MDLHELKQKFDRNPVFWGGGVDTQGILGTGPMLHPIERTTHA